MKKIVLWNSPALAGKDCAINYLRDMGIDLIKAECKEPLFELTIKLFNITPEQFYTRYNDRKLKEVPDSIFTISWPRASELQKIIQSSSLHVRISNGAIGGKDIQLSSREALIYVSEVVVKPNFGGDWFGKARVTNLVAREGEVFTDGSCAFPSELTPLINKLGQENILLLRIHREGCTFEGDSRSFIPDGVIDNTIDVSNNGTEQEYLDLVLSLVEEFLYGSVTN